MSEIDYGPLAGLAGRWKGEQGEDKSPEPDGTEVNHYTETIQFSTAGDVDNAETQELAAIHYQLEVHRIRDGKAIHNQTGYWIWEAESKLVMHCFCIPRGLTVVAGGYYQGETTDDGRISITVSAAADSPDWKIIESPFLRDNATTRSFQQQLIISPEEISYRQTTLVDIYQYQLFQHTDENRLKPC